MNKKQLIGLVIAGFVFIVVCSASIYMNSWSKAQTNDSIEFMESYLMEQSTLPVTPFVGVVSVEGTIVDSGVTDVFGNVVGYNHQATLDYIDDMIYSDSNSGIILYVNSPGGSVYDSDELYLKLEEYRATTGRPIWTYMADQACSGGYYIAMATDKIYANRNTTTGSIGVIISLTSYKDLFDKIGVEEIYITSGRNKAMGAGDLDMTDEQQAIFQSVVDEAYEQFVGIVSEGRNLSISDTKTIADGRIYTAKQALNNHLIDEIASYDDMLYDLYEEIGNVEIYVPSTAALFDFNSLFSFAQDIISRSDTEVISDFLETNGSGVPMYYAIPGKY